AQDITSRRCRARPSRVRAFSDLIESDRGSKSFCGRTFLTAGCSTLLERCSKLKGCEGFYPSRSHLFYRAVLPALAGGGAALMNSGIYRGAPLHKRTAL